MADSSYFTSGSCTARYTVRDNYQFEAKVFPLTEANQLARETFSQTQILRHNALDGEVSTQGDSLGEFVTFWENVKPGYKERIYRDEIVSAGWVSKANGLCPRSCGWAPTGTSREVQIDKALQTIAVGQREEICMNEFLGTWQHTNLARGMKNHGDDIFVDAAIYYAFEKKNYVSIDEHFWGGDFAGPNPRYMHIDGVIKQAVQALDNAQDWDIDYLFTSLQAGMSIEGVIGGRSFAIPFNTTDTQTIDDLIAEITDASKYFLEDYTSILKTATRSGTTLSVTADPKYPYPLQLLITDGSGIKFDLDGKIIPSGDVVTTASITETVVQAAVKGQVPIGIRKESVSAANVLQKFEELEEEIHSTKPELLSDNFGGNLFVAPNVWSAMKMALKKLNQQYTGDVDLGLGEEARDILGFRRVIKANYMPMNEMFFGRPQDLHVATDLVSDVSETELGYDRKCQQAWFRSTFALGFLISELNNVAGTFCGRPAGEFQAAMNYDIC